MVEVFIEGTEPAERCSRALHRKLLLPYPFQRYPLDADGSLMIPGDELQELLRQEQTVRLDPRLWMLEALRPEGFVRVPVTPLPDRAAPLDGATDEGVAAAPLDLTSDGATDTAGRPGTDGRRPRVVWFDDEPRERRAERRTVPRSEL
jgi:hypothetical protein